MKRVDLKIPKAGVDTKNANPYLAARNEWNERYGSYISAAKNWRMVAFASLAISVIAVIGLFYIGSQRQVIPYVVEVDKLGAISAVTHADRMSKPDQRIIRSQLSQWIMNVRSIYVDAAAEKQGVTAAYAMINRRGVAYATLNDYFRGADPFVAAQTQTRSVTIQSALPISENTWRIEWIEEVRNRNDGKLISNQDWQATITITISTPTTDQLLITNPLGIYIDSFSWSSRLS